jgi:hypothetical protein
MNPNQKNPSDICPKPKKLYKLHKLSNAKQKNKNKHRKKFRNKILKLLNYKDLLTEKKTLILTKIKYIFLKTKRKIMSLTFL